MKTEDGESQDADSQGSETRPARARKKSQQALDDYLSALFPMPTSAAAPAEVAVAGRVADEDAAWIERERIEPNPAQPRRTWSEESLRELGQSLARDGQMQACVVRPHPSKMGQYQLVSGERRWRASAPEFGNLKRLRCTIRDVGDEESLRLALVENLQREDLNDIDKARAFVELRDSLRASDPRVTWSHVGQAVGLSREYLQRLKALLDLPEEVQEMVRGGTLSGRSARALTSLKDANLQTQLAHEIQQGKLSSDQALERARALAAANEQPAETNSRFVTRGSQTRKPASSTADADWESDLRQAVQLLAQVRKRAAIGQGNKKMQKLIAQAQAHIEALAASGDS